MSSSCGLCLMAKRLLLNFVKSSTASKEVRASKLKGLVAATSGWPEGALLEVASLEVAPLEVASLEVAPPEVADFLLGVLLHTSAIVAPSCE